LFARWFAAIAMFFVAANAAGCVRPMGLLPFRYTGFPFTFAVWGNGVEEYLDLGMLALNVATGIAVASLLSGVICFWRSRIPAPPSGAGTDRGRQAEPPNQT
jgi:hypothetical protein